jgi:hypothetical protein
MLAGKGKICCKEKIVQICSIYVGNVSTEHTINIMKSFLFLFFGSKF